MKSLLLSAAIALASVSVSAAYQDGTYNCGSKATYLEFTYKISTITTNGIAMPYLDITKKYYKKPNDPNSTDKVFQIQGIATVYKTESGEETLVIGNIAIDTTSGRPSCSQ